MSFITRNTPFYEQILENGNRYNFPHDKFKVFAKSESANLREADLEFVIFVHYNISAILVYEE